MAGTGQGMAVVVALVMSCIFLHTAADSTIQNAASSPILVNERYVTMGEVVTIQIDSGKSTSSVDLLYVRNATGVQIRNSREYFVVVNQDGYTGTRDGRIVRTLDLVEGRKVESSF